MDDTRRQEGQVQHFEEVFTLIGIGSKPDEHGRAVFIDPAHHLHLLILLWRIALVDADRLNAQKRLISVISRPIRLKQELILAAPGGWHHRCLTIPPTSGEARPDLAVDQACCAESPLSEIHDSGTTNIICLSSDDSCPFFRRVYIFLPMPVARGAESITATSLKRRQTSAAFPDSFNLGDRLDWLAPTNSQPPQDKNTYPSVSLHGSISTAELSQTKNAGNQSVAASNVVAFIILHLNANHSGI